MKDKIANLLSAGVVEIIDKNNLIKRLNSDKKLRVKYGIDPTSPTAHLGHMVPLRKLRVFQDMGHIAVFLVGDFTAQIGDPTGKSQTRKMLTHKQTQKMAKDYFEQAFKILDREKTEIHLQSEWYKNISFVEVIGLMAKTTKDQLMRHHTFRQREKDGLELGFHEMLYPLLMAFDSVKLKADIELGGIDQKFNFLLTRQVMERFNLSPEDVILMKYLPGIDGSEKMSKSEGNFIGVTEKPIDQVRKLLGIQDKDIEIFFELLTDKEAPRIHPFEAKKELALEVVSAFHGQKVAKSALAKFEAIKQDKGRWVKSSNISIKKGTRSLLDLLSEIRKETSKRELKRLIEQGGVKISGKKVVAWDYKVKLINSVSIEIGREAIVEVNPG